MSANPSFSPLSFLFAFDHICSFVRSCRTWRGSHGTRRLRLPSNILIYISPCNYTCLLQVIQIVKTQFTSCRSTLTEHSFLKCSYDENCCHTPCPSSLLPYQHCSGFNHKSPFVLWKRPAVGWVIKQMENRLTLKMDFFLKGVEREGGLSRYQGYTCGALRYNTEVDRA